LRLHLFKIADIVPVRSICSVFTITGDFCIIVSRVGEELGRNAKSRNRWDWAKKTKRAVGELGSQSNPICFYILAVILIDN